MRRIILICVLLVVAAAGWTSAWFLITQRIEHAIEVWIAYEKTRDHYWTCSNRAAGGFPLRFRIDCASPSFASQSGPIRSAAASHLTATASIFAPFDIAFTITGPMKIDARNGAATFQWSDLDGSLRMRGPSPDISVRASALGVEETANDLASWEGTKVQNMAVRLQRSPDRAPDSDAQSLTLNVDGAKAPPLDSFFGNEELFRTKISMTIMNAGAASIGNFAERLDRWIASDGRVQISSLMAEKGHARLEASGELTLDDRRRPAGQLAVRVAGVQPILSRLNLPAAPLAIEGLLRGSGNRAGAASLIENRTLPLELRGGRLYIGPLRMPIVIPPLI